MLVHLKPKNIEVMAEKQVGIKLKNEQNKQVHQRNLSKFSVRGNTTFKKH
jgi:hypothetical protein